MRSSSTRGLGAAVVACAALMGSVASGQTVELATTVAFVEGPTSDRDGNLYVTAGKDLFKVRTDVAGLPR